MRSRYTAFVQQRAPYLLSSWHASTRPASIAFDDAVKWLGLKILRAPMADGDHAIVEFVARYRVAGRAHRLHETSRFVREAGHWYYVDGDIAEPASD
jgi:SEC-C motif domain protein